MSRYLLLILLASWSQLAATQCDTGMAIVDHKLSVSNSLMANADVAFLKGYNASSLHSCLEECCSSKYGSCSVVTFKKSNASSKPNCLHFNCRPLVKCKFQSSNETDSFTFPALPAPPRTSSTTPVPSTRHENVTPTPSQSPRKDPTTSEDVTKEETALFPEEQFAVNNDNTTIKPRKGVDDSRKPEDQVARSGVKPRKGVTMEYLQYLAENVTKSKVKPRKGVGPYSTVTAPTSTVINFTDVGTTRNGHWSSDSSVNDTNSNELLTSLEEVFADDPHAEKSLIFDVGVTEASRKLEISSYSKSFVHQHSSLPFAPTAVVGGSSSTHEVQPSRILPSNSTPEFTFVDFEPNEAYDSNATNTESRTLATPSTTLQSSIGHYISEPTASKYPTDASSKHATDSATTKQSSIDSTTSQRPSDSASDDSDESTTSKQATHSWASEPLVDLTSSESPSSPTTRLTASWKASILPLNAVQMTQGDDNDDEESESERKYKSSMHLVLSLVFGLLVLFAVMGVVAKRVYDGWLRRHYRRMDFLIDGMYNGYG